MVFSERIGLRAGSKCWGNYRHPVHQRERWDALHGTGLLHHGSNESDFEHDSNNDYDNPMREEKA